MAASGAAGVPARAARAFFTLLPRSTGEALALAKRHDARLAGQTWLEIDEERPIRHALEPRAESFRDADDLLREHGVAMVVADTAGRFPRFDALTSDHVYVRLHGAQELYHSGYTDAELDEWAGLIRRWAHGEGDEPPRDVYIYFDNDARGHAPHDARALAQRTSG
nr:DUF72 domain-containing protein [Microbacterium murale]